MSAGTATAPWAFLDTLRKGWSQLKPNPGVPKDTPYMMELHALDPELDGISLFMNEYDDGVSLDLDAIAHMSLGLGVRNLDEQPEKKSAWLDDRTYSSYFPVAQIPSQSEQVNNSHDSIHNTFQDRRETHDTDDFQRTQGPELGSGFQAMATPIVASASKRYIPNSRRYLLPLSAGMLYRHLNKKVMLSK